MAVAEFAGAPAWQASGRGPALRRWLVALASALVLMFVMAGAAAAQTYRFNTIVVEGNQRIESSTVLSYANVPRGQAVSAGQLNAAYQRVLGSGLFETVTFLPEGSRLVIRVVEFPTINAVAFEGNRKLEDEELGAIVRSRSRQVYSPATAEQDAAIITQAYAQAGRFAATVTPRVIRRSNNRVDLVFEVNEGGVVEIERISFLGNRDFSDRRLRNVLETKQAGILRGFIMRDTFLADRIEFDKQVLSDFYMSRGYVDFQVLSVTSEMTRRRDAFFITFNVHEGQQFRFGNISVTSEVNGADPDEYARAIRIREGKVYNPAAVDRAIERMETLALRQGLDFVRVEPRVTRNDRDLTLDIEFAIVRGPRIFVERIDIEGNVTTLDRVIRNQFRSVEGDPFNPREIRESSERIRALGFFSRADVETREGTSPEQVVVDVNVEEQPTGALSFGLSYSVSAGAGIAVNFSEKNFLGRGQTLSFSFDTSDTNNNVSFGFVEPNFLGRDVRFKTNIYFRESENEYASYSTRLGGLSMGLNFPVGEYSRLGFDVGMRYDKVYNVDAASSPILLNEEVIGERFLGLVGYDYSYDTRIGGLDPNAGVLLRFGQQVFSGDATYAKTTALAMAERKILNEEVTLRASIEGGAVTVLNGTSRVTDRFFGNEMRGFEPRGFGPRDTPDADGDPLGGNFFAVAKFEAEFPLGLPEEYGISGGVFLDIGSVWGLDDTSGFGTVDDAFHPRSAIGFSIFWTTVLGPLRFNFSTPLEMQPYDREQNFEFTISTRF